jgi:hypothetical protein
MSESDLLATAGMDALVGLSCTGLSHNTHQQQLPS